MNLNTRRLILTLVATAILLLVATSPFTTLFVVRGLASEIVDDSLKGLTLSSEMTLNISDGFLETSLAMNAPSSHERRNYIARIQEKTTETDTRLKTYEQTISDAREKKLFDQLVTSRQNYRGVRDNIFHLLDEGERNQAETLFKEKCMPLFSDYLQALEALVKLNIDENTNRGEHIVRVANKFLGLQGVLLVFFCIYAFFVPALTFYERLSRRSLED